MTRHIPRGSRAAAGRLAAAVVVLGTLTAALLVPPPPQPARAAWQAVESAELVCPELSVPDESASLVTGLVAGSRTSAANSQGSTAALRALETDEVLARVPEVDDPVTLLVATRSTAPVVLGARGSWAGTALAGVATRELTGEAAGLSSAACLPPRTDWWFVGAGSRLGRRAALVVSNSSQEPASFDISLHAQSGPVDALAGKGITLGPRSHVRLRLDALREGEDLLSVHVQATTGRVTAALRDVAPPVGEWPRGVDYLPPAAQPATRLLIPGVPAGKPRRELVLVNPGTQFASVSARLISAKGTVDLPALTSLAVPAGSSISYSLDDALAAASGTLELLSDEPVTAALRAVWGGAGRRDLLWLAATPPLAEPNTVAGAAVVPSGRGLTTTVAIAAPESDVAGRLTVLVSGDRATPILGAGGALESGALTARRQKADAPVNPVVLTGETTSLPDQVVRVPAGTQRTIEVSTAQGGQLHLVWQAAPGSGPASLAHQTVDTRRFLATGYPWWPTVSQVPVSAVRDDVGTLAPTQ
jgi:hypothetical protein